MNELKEMTTIPETELMEEDKKIYKQRIGFIPPWVKCEADLYKFIYYLNFKINRMLYQNAGFHEDARKIEIFYNSGE